MVSLLLKSGADPNLTDSKGRSPLHAAAKLGYTDIVRYISPYILYFVLSIAEFSFIILELNLRCL